PHPQPSDSQCPCLPGHQDVGEPVGCVEWEHRSCKDGATWNQEGLCLTKAQWNDHCAHEVCATPGDARGHDPSLGLCLCWGQQSSGMCLERQRHILQLSCTDGIPQISVTEGMGSQAEQLLIVYMLLGKLLPRSLQGQRDPCLVLGLGFLGLTRPGGELLHSLGLPLRDPRCPDQDPGNVFPPFSLPSGHFYNTLEQFDWGHFRALAEESQLYEHSLSLFLQQFQHPGIYVFRLSSNRHRKMVCLCPSPGGVRTSEAAILPYVPYPTSPTTGSPPATHLPILQPRRTSPLGALMTDPITGIEVPVLAVTLHPQTRQWLTLGGTYCNPLTKTLAPLEMGGPMEDPVTGGVSPILGVGLDENTGLPAALGDILPGDSFVEPLSGKTVQLQGASRREGQTLPHMGLIPISIGAQAIDPWTGKPGPVIGAQMDPSARVVVPIVQVLKALPRGVRDPGLVCRGVYAAERQQRKSLQPQGKQMQRQQLPLVVVAAMWHFSLPFAADREEWEQEAQVVLGVRKFLQSLAQVAEKLRQAAHRLQGQEEETRLQQNVALRGNVIFRVATTLGPCPNNYFIPLCSDMIKLIILPYQTSLSLYPHTKVPQVIFPNGCNKPFPKLSCVVNISLLYRKAPEITLKVASHLPATEAQGSAFQGAFFYQSAENTLFIGRECLASVGSFVLLLIRCLAHIIAGEPHQDSDPAFLGSFYKVFITCTGH
ncbi:hypothetical protein EGK_06879, partial [Macaca mulatta]